MPSARPASPSVATLRALALARALPARATLQQVIDRMGYVQADPIQAPARAQDLILVQRVDGYRAGDLEKNYPLLDCEEETLHNYGFVPRSVQRWLHPRTPTERRLAHAGEESLFRKVLEVVRSLGQAHPRQVEAALKLGTTTNYWGGQSSSTTRVLEFLLYRGDLRVVRRDRGIRVYEPASHLEAFRQTPLDERTRADALLDLLLGQYAPISESRLRAVIQLSGHGAPGLKTALRDALKARRKHLRSAEVDGQVYLWPDEPAPPELPRQVRLMAPFDPLVWDRHRFEHLHGWEFKFEAYTPEKQRRFGYYALPLFWGDRAIGWATLRTEGDDLHADLGFIDGEPRSREFSRSLDEELERLRVFLEG